MTAVDPSPRPAERFESRLEFETLISDLSSGFIDLPAAEVDSAIAEAQRRVCEFLGVDRSELPPPGFTLAYTVAECPWSIRSSVPPSSSRVVSSSRR